MADLPMRLVDVFSSPLGMMVLILAFLGIAGTIAWAFWDKQRAGHSATATNMPLTPVAPPMLNPNVTRPAIQTSVGSGADGGLRNIVIAIIGIVAVIIGAQFAIGRGGEQAGAQSAANNTPADDPINTASVPSSAPVLVDCDEGPVWTKRDEDRDVIVGIEREPIKSYVICAGRQSAQFDVIDFMAEEDGAFIFEPVWHPVDLPVLGTRNDEFYYKREFALSRDEFNMVAGPGSNVSDYDLFLAIGLAGWDIESGVADQRAANRGFHIARYVLEELRGEEDANDCRSPAVVYALSVGQYQPGGSTAAAENVAEATRKMVGAGTPVAQLTRQSAPILFGVRYLQKSEIVPKNETQAERRARAERQHRALIEDFLRSQGSSIAGFNLREFGTPQTLFVERACSRAAIQ
ncbi:hypothetical protein [Parvularcula marina]|uniref:Uncharacterized protein n=1 Tax=Parvularcula marina TaxID=2292771 RepID=A0A371RIR8_9PROT|nr:hypothetical protein [Parvularcula marina]RFB05355.1 hypothetical protein DX908_08850 [Parvularcula marina]